MRKRKLTQNQYIHLLLIRSGFGHQTHLAARLGRDKVTVHDAIRRLVRRGLVHEPAGRQGALTLTCRGEQVIEGMALIRENGSVWAGKVEVK